MVAIRPVEHALVPRDSAAAERVQAPNYDEFQNDREIFELIRARRDCMLRVTMAHCDVASADDIEDDGSESALARATGNLAALAGSDLMRRAHHVLWVNDIADPRRPGVRQIGLGGLARTADIRSDGNPNGALVRNEGIRDEKARGRAVLIERTRAMTDSVNMAVADESGRFAAALEAFADARGCDFAVSDEKGNVHRVWLVREPAAIERLTDVLASEGEAYVADGNHRSAAAAMCGLDGFLAVFFPATRMGIRPYNRLVRGSLAPEALIGAAAEAFALEALTLQAFQPERTHDVGLYAGGRWYRLTPRADVFDAADAAGSIDAAIVQQRLFGDVLGIDDARDPRLTFVGGDRSADYLRSRVDAGEHDYAVTLPPVTMAQFIAVCRQNRFMPPKSTWFEPKLRSGMVNALLG